jgi:hypothetical protein
MRWSRCPLCTNARRLIFIVLAHWNNNPSVYMSLHSDTLFLILIWDTANTNIIAFRLLRPRLELTIYCTRGEHCNNYTTYAAQIIFQWMYEMKNIFLSWSCLVHIVFIKVETILTILSKFKIGFFEVILLNNGHCWNVCLSICFALIKEGSIYHIYMLPLNLSTDYELFSNQSEPHRWCNCYNASECCFFCYIMTRASYIRWDDQDVRFVLMPVDWFL